MQRFLEKRLQRLQADLMGAEDAASARRNGLRALVAVGGNLRRMLAQRGVDPAQVAAMRNVDEAAAELAAMGAGGHAPAAAGPAYGSGRDADDFIRQLVALALLHYADGERPDPACASLMEWHAWCLVTPASKHERSILLDPDVVRYQRVLRLGSGAACWR